MDIGSVEKIASNIKDATNVIRNLLRTSTMQFENATLIEARLQSIDMSASLIHEVHLNVLDKVADKLSSVGEDKD